MKVLKLFRPECMPYMLVPWLGSLVWFYGILRKNHENLTFPPGDTLARSQSFYLSLSVTLNSMNYTLYQSQSQE
jgi:hypothetical protein